MPFGTPQNETLQRLLEALQTPQETGPESLPVRTQAGLVQTGVTVGGTTPTATPTDHETTMGWLFRILSEFARPQKAIFAGLDELDHTGSLSSGISAMVDEFQDGIGTGQFKRDVTFGDLISRVPREERSGLVRAAGLAGDIVADPLNFVSVLKPLRWAVSGVKSATSIGFNTAKNLAPEVISRNIDKAVDSWKTAFIVEEAATEAGKRAGILTDSVQNYAELHRRPILRAYKEDIKKVQTISKEFGIQEDQVLDIVRKHVEFTKLADPAQGVRRALNDTVARVWNRYGVQGFDDYMQRAGFRRLRDERPVRKAILDGKFDQLEQTVINQFGRDAGDRMKDLVFELKERALERDIIEGFNRVRLDPESPAGHLFASMRKDYLMLAATDDFRAAYANLPGLSKSSTGFKMNPFHTSELSSNLQKIGVDEANRLLRTPRPNRPGESMFRVRNPETNEFIHLPLMDKGFHTDPFYLDAVRSYYGRVAVEQSQLLNDLVRGYGKVLDPSDFREPSRVLTKAEATQASALVTTKPADQLGFEQIHRSLTKEAAERLEENGLKLLRGISGFENVALPTEAADLIMKAHSVYKDPEAVSGILGAFGKVLNQVWKPWTLFVYPEFHTRNIVSNMFLMNIGGMPGKDIPKFVAQGVRVLTANAPDATKARVYPALEKLVGTNPSTKLGRVLTGPGIVDPTSSVARQAIQTRDYLLANPDAVAQLIDADEAAFLRLAVDLGVVRGGEFGSAEVSRFIEQGLQFQASGKGKKLAGFIPFASTPDNSIPLQVGMAAGSGIEDSMRLGMFIWATTEGGMDILQARKHVLKHMIDYGKLTDFERKYMKGVLMPFYAWTRHSLPLMAESFIDEPHKWSAINKIKMDMEQQMFAEGEVSDERLVPEYVSRGASVPTRRAPNGDYQYFIFNEWLPQAQLAELDEWDEVKKFPLIQNLSPAIQVAAELLFQKSLFLDADFGAAKTEFAGMRMSPEVATVLRTLRPLSIVDRFTRDNSPELADNMWRLLTGFNKVRVSQQTALRAFGAKVQDARRDASTALREASEALNNGFITPEEYNQEFQTIQANLIRTIRTGRQ